jgi:formylmethanofuran dehydrogenase subunit D
VKSDIPALSHDRFIDDNAQKIAEIALSPLDFAALAMAESKLNSGSRGGRVILVASRGVL